MDVKRVEQTGEQTLAEQQAQSGQVRAVSLIAVTDRPHDLAQQVKSDRDGSKQKPVVEVGPEGEEQTDRPVGT